MYQDEEDVKEINHHGSAVSVETTKAKEQIRPEDLVNINERKEQMARKAFYDNVDESLRQKNKRQYKLKACEFIGEKIVPMVIIMFTLAYWFYGITSTNVNL